MPLLSKVIKGGQIRFNPSVYQLESGLPPFPAGLEETFPAREESGSNWTGMPGAAGQLLGSGDLRAAAEKKCAEILAGAFRERETILEQTRLEIVALEQEARQTGYDAGYLEGLAEGRREVGMLRQEAEEFLREAKGLRRQELLRLEPEVVRLSVTIAERLLGRQLTLLPETIVSVVAQALQEAREHAKVLVRVHPDDLPVCRAFAGELANALRETADLDFIGDKSLAVGDCLVETDGALLECRLGERLAALLETLAMLAAQRLSGRQEQPEEAVAQ